MKKKIWILVVIVLLAVAVFFGYRYISLPNYEAPFKAEEVKSVTLSTFWESKTIEDEKEIENLVSQLNKVKIISDYNENKDPIEAGTYGYTICFDLVDGKQVEYIAVQTQGLKYKFVDENGMAYNARNFTLGKILATN